MPTALPQSTGKLLTTFWQGGYVAIHKIGTVNAMGAFQTKLLDLRQATLTCYPRGFFKAQVSRNFEGFAWA